MTTSIPRWGTELRALVPNVYAYVQAGGPGIDNTSVANAGVVVGEDAVMVIDTLAVPVHTKPFIAAIREVTDLPVRHVVNTHHHADHTFGNCFFLPAEIVGHEYCREQTIEFGLPIELITQPELQPGLDELRLAPAVTTFRDKLTYHYGDVEIQLLHLGVAHTRGDALVYLPRERVLFGGDVAFHYVTPLALPGSVRGWLDVLDRLRDLPIEFVVPGHGPVGTMRELGQMGEYLALIELEARARFDDGLDVVDAALDIDVGSFAEWLNVERIAANVLRLYAEFRGEPDAEIGVPEGRAAIGEYLRRQGG